MEQNIELFKQKTIDLLDTLDISSFVENKWWDVEGIMSDMADYYYNHNDIPDWCKTYLFTYLTQEEFAKYLTHRGYKVIGHRRITYSVDL